MTILSTINAESTPLNYNLNEYKCIKCNHMVQAPVYQCICGHRICGSCKDDDQMPDSHCPGNSDYCLQVNLAENVNVKVDFAAQRDLKNVYMYCEFKSQGCNAVLVLGEMRAHNENCIYSNNSLVMEESSDEENVVLHTDSSRGSSPNMEEATTITRISPSPRTPENGHGKNREDGVETKYGTEFNNFTAWCVHYGLSQATINTLLEQDVCEVDIMSGITDTDISKLNLTTGQTLALKQAVDQAKNVMFDKAERDRVKDMEQRYSHEKLHIESKANGNVTDRRDQISPVKFTDGEVVTDEKTES